MVRKSWGSHGASGAPFEPHHEPLNGAKHAPVCHTRWHDPRAQRCGGPAVVVLLLTSCVEKNFVMSCESCCVSTWPDLHGSRKSFLTIRRAARQQCHPVAKNCKPKLQPSRPNTHVPTLRAFAELQSMPLPWAWDDGARDALESPSLSHPAAAARARRMNPHPYSVAFLSAIYAFLDTTAPWTGKAGRPAAGMLRTHPWHDIISVHVRWIRWYDGNLAADVETRYQSEVSNPDMSHRSCQTNLRQFYRYMPGAGSRYLIACRGCLPGLPSPAGDG